MLQARSINAAHAGLAISSAMGVSAIILSHYNEWKHVFYQFVGHSINIIYGLEKAHD